MQFGHTRIMGDLNAGVMQRIYYNLLSSNATSVTISGLNGDVDEEYLLVLRGVNNSGSASDYWVRLNNDSGANYGYQVLYGANTVIAAVRGSSTAAYFDYGPPQDGERIFGEVLIYAKSGYVRTMLFQVCNRTTGTTVTEFDIFGQSWNNTVDNITSLVVGGATNGLGVGTSIELYRKVSKL